MSFWSTFYKESLHSPWVIQPENSMVQAPGIDSPMVFLAPSSFAGSEQQAMMERMITALKKTSAEIHLEFSDQSVGELELSSAVEKVMVFGEQKSIGRFESMGTFKVMGTHDLVSISKNPKKKKEAWLHLQKFAGIL